MTKWVLIVISRLQRKKLQQIQLALRARKGLKRQAALNQQEISFEQKTYVSASSQQRDAKLDIQKDKLNEDIAYLDNVDLIDVKSIELALQ